MTNIKVSSWNLGNLFDTTLSEMAADYKYTKDKGWTKSVYNKKIKNLAKAIKSFHDGKGPDLLGICEVENKIVIEDLLEQIGRDDYQIVHVESEDIRGIDCAIIYSDTVFEFNQSESHIIHNRYRTRDIIQTNLTVQENGAELNAFMNHWPSRMKGLAYTEPLRIAAAEHCARLVDRILKYPPVEFSEINKQNDSLEIFNQRWNKNILLMGDFNDEPFDKSILVYLQAVRDLDKLEEPLKAPRGAKKTTAEKYYKDQAYLFNCMWKLMGNSDVGTNFYSQSQNTMTMIDQIIVSRGLYYGNDGLKIDPDSVNIFTDDVAKKSGRPRDYNWKMGTGYSDHLPLQCVINTL